MEQLYSKINKDYQTEYCVKDNYKPIFCKSVESSIWKNTGW